MVIKPSRAWSAASLTTVLALLGWQAGAAPVTPVGPPSVSPSKSGAPAPIGAVRAANTVSGVSSPPRLHRRHRRATLAVTALHTVWSANSSSRSAPTQGAYINAALYYDFEPGRLYTVNTSPRFLTAITLRPGEKLISKAAGDTVRWVLGETVQGGGATQQVIVMVKPVRGDLRTNIILTTDQRTYLLDAVSREGDTYTSVIAWNYPQEQMIEAQAAHAAAAQSVQLATAVDHLNFGYAVKAVHSRHAPRWQPLRVFDDGLKTYIQFPADLGASEAPPLFLVGPKDQAQLVNYRLLGGYYVVDRLIDVAELRLGEKPQVVVRITRTAKGT
jgi:P-type conjugative transfer protein TrbG